MKTLSLIQKKYEPTKDQQLKIGGLAVCVVFILVLSQHLKRKKNKLNQFLYSLGFTEIDFKTQKSIYPKVKIMKDKIIFSNSNKLNKQSVEEKRTAFEKFFEIEILEIEDSQQTTIIFYQK